MTIFDRAADTSVGIKHATRNNRGRPKWNGNFQSVFHTRQPNWHVPHLPGDGFDDAVQLIVGRWVVAAHREHEVDGIKQAREGLGEVGCLVRLQRVLQSLLWATQTQRDTEPQTPDWFTRYLHTRIVLKKTLLCNTGKAAEQPLGVPFLRLQRPIRSENTLPNLLGCYETIYIMSHIRI